MDSLAPKGRVATLQDLATLGVSMRRERSEAAEEDPEESVVASTFRQAFTTYSAATCDSVAHLGAFAADSLLQGLRARLRGPWVGKVSAELGGYEQTLIFLDDDHTVQIKVLGQEMTGAYVMDCSQVPYHLNLSVLPDRGSVQAPPIPYIMRMSGEALHLCGPSGPHLQRPFQFQGPGMCIMHRPQPWWEQKDMSPAAQTATGTPSQDDSFTRFTSCGSRQEPECEHFSRQSSDKDEASGSSSSLDPHPCGSPSLLPEQPPELVEPTIGELMEVTPPHQPQAPDSASRTLRDGVTVKVSVNPVHLGFAIAAVAAMSLLRPR